MPTSERPFALQSCVPIWVGGRTRRSLRRAVELADGWMPFGLGVDDIAAMLGDFELPDGFDVVLATDGTVDPTDEPDRTRGQLEALGEVGATAVTCSLRARSAEHCVEQLSALRDLASGLEGG